MRKLDEVRDAKHYNLHKVDLERVVKILGLDLDGDNINDILDRLNQDWDDDYDGVDSYWLEGKVSA